jgi:hypothetical protein
MVSGTLVKTNLRESKNMKKFIAIIAVIATMPVSSLAGQVRVEGKDAIRCGLYTKSASAAHVDAVKKTDKAKIAR